MNEQSNGPVDTCWKPPYDHVSDKTAATIETNFMCHPLTDDQMRRIKDTRDNARGFAWMLNRFCPPSRELSLAMTKLEECMMWANASIARDEPNKGNKNND